MLAMFNANGYPLQFITYLGKQIISHEDVTPPPEDLVKEFFNLVDPAKKNRAVLPYIKGLTEPLTNMTSKSPTNPSKRYNNISHLPKTDPPQRNKLM